MLVILPNQRMFTRQGLRLIWAKGDVMDVESIVRRGIWELDKIVLRANEYQSSAYLAIQAGRTN